MASGVSRQDESFREYALTGPLWKVLVSVCLPLALYQGLQSVFAVADALMAAHIGTSAVSSVGVFKQVQSVISALGGGLAVGGCIKISEAYGRRDFDAVRRQVSTLYALAVAVGIVLMAVLVPFARPFLSLFAPENLIRTGLGYFRVEVITLVVTFFNNVFIAIERARGHSSKILILNMAVIFTKLAFTAVFVYGLEADVTMMAVATLLGQLVVTFYALYAMPRDEGAFRFSVRNIDWARRTILPIFDLSYPIVAEKMFFSAGKVAVQTMSGVYDADAASGGHTAGALSISNNIGGLTTGWQSGVQDGAAPLISQIRGGEKYRRTLRIYYRLLAVNVVIGLVGLVIVDLTLPGIAGIFARSKNYFDPAFQQMIVDIHRYEMLGYVTLGINAATLALLLGYGYTKLTLLLNVLRILSRILVLGWIQRFTTMGAEAIGVTMMVSNIFVGVSAIVVAVPVVARIKKRIRQEEQDASTTPEGEE